MPNLVQNPEKFWNGFKAEGENRNDYAVKLRVDNLKSDHMVSNGHLYKEVTYVPSCPMINGLCPPPGVCIHDTSIKEVN